MALDSLQVSRQHRFSHRALSVPRHWCTHHDKVMGAVMAYVHEQKNNIIPSTCDTVYVDVVYMYHVTA